MNELEKDSKQVLRASLYDLVMIFEYRYFKNQQTMT